MLGLPKAQVLILLPVTALVRGHAKDSTVLPVDCSHQLELTRQLQILFVPCSACTQRLSPVRYLHGVGDCCLLIDIKIPQGWGGSSSAEARSILPEDHGSIPGTHRVTSTCNPRPREAAVLFWLPWATSTHDTHTEASTPKCVCIPAPGVYSDKDSSCQLLRRSR